MVDPKPLILLPGAGLIIPEGVLPGAAIAGHHRIGEAEMENAAERSPRLEAEQRVLGPRRRIIDVGRARNDVVVAGERQRLFVSEQRLRVSLEAGEPGELVIELLRGRGVTVRRIDGSGADRASAGKRDRRLDIARLLVARVAGQRRYGFVDGMLR